MEVIHLILGKANPERMNGVNRVVNELAHRQVQNGMNVQVWGITFNKLANYPGRNYVTQLFQMYKNPFRLDKQLVQAIRRLAGTEVVFHLHGGFLPQMFSAAQLLHLYRIRFVFTPHGSYNAIAMQRNWLVKKVYFYLFEQRLLRYARAVHALGKSEVDGLLRIYPNHRSVLIPYGFDPVKVAIPKVVPGFIIGYCGRLDNYTKGLKELLIGFDRFYASCKQAQLWIIGDGVDKIGLERLAESLPAAQAISFLGGKYGVEKNELLRQLNVFAAPSRNEGLPTAVLEAASFGIPCLVTEATNLGDCIRAYDAGTVIPETNSTAIYCGLKLLHTRMLCQHPGLQHQSPGHSMVAEVFDWNRLLLQFQNMYQL